MSYPQPNAAQYVTNGYEYFRLNTLLTSPGDIYESEVSGHALAIGPESDIANVVVNYFDDQIKPTFLQATTISPGRAFVGRVDARNDATYAPIERPGRILFWSRDLYDPGFRPKDFDPDADEIQFIQPQLDVIQYFAPQGSLGPARVDKEYQFQVYLNAQTSWLVVPFYGRRYAFLNFTDKNATEPAGLGVIGLNYAITDNASSNPYHQETVIQTLVPVNPDQSTNVIVIDGQNGRFDALVLQIQGNPAPLRVVTSDYASGCPNGGT